jgi:hypothetical protein
MSAARRRALRTMGWSAASARSSSGKGRFGGRFIRSRLPHSPGTPQIVMLSYLEDQLHGGEAATQRLGRLVFGSRRFSGLRDSSAARPEAENLVILPARFGSDELVRLYDERGRWRQIRVGPPS